MHPYPRAPFQCPHCGGVFQIPPEVIGQAVACPHCNGGVLIPETPFATAPPIAQGAAPSPIAEAPPSTDPWQPPPSHPPRPEPGFAPPLGRTSDVPVSEPPVVTRPEPARPASDDPVEPPPMTVQTPGISSAIASPTTLANDSQNSSRRQFVIPTFEGGQTMIQEPVKTVTVGRRQRQLRGMNSEEKATRRWIKNVIVASLCTGILAMLMWWLLS